MNQSSGFLKRHSLVLGIILMFLFTWPIDLANSKVLPFEVPFAVAILIGYGLFIASVIMTWLTLGGKAVVGLLKRFLIWRVGLKWYLVALFLLPGFQFLSVLLNALVTKTQLDFSSVFAVTIFGPSAVLPLFILPYFVFDALTNGEEIAWRGYILPRLQYRYSALISSLFIGVIWGLWHLPRFLAPGNTSPFGWFMVRIVLDAVLYTWLYNNTKGSLLLVTLFHAAGNTGGAFLPVTTNISGANLTTLYFQIAIEAIVVVVVLLTAGPARLSRTEAKQVQE